jgi:hypothetical protein
VYSNRDDYRQTCGIGTTACGCVGFISFRKGLHLGLVVHKYAVAGLTGKMFSVLVANLGLGFAPYLITCKQDVRVMITRHHLCHMELCML